MSEPTLDWSDEATFVYARPFEGLWRRLLVKLRLRKRLVPLTINCFQQNLRLYRAYFTTEYGGYAVFVPVNKELVKDPIMEAGVRALVRLEAKERFSEASAPESAPRSA